MRDKVIETAKRLGLEVDVRRLDASTATVQEAADAVGCPAAQIAKSLVFVADGDPVLCIASGAHRVQTDRLADVLDVAEVRQATPEEVRAATGFSVGGVPPFGHGLPVVLDETLLDHELRVGGRRRRPQPVRGRSAGAGALLHAGSGGRRRRLIVRLRRLGACCVLLGLGPSPRPSRRATWVRPPTVAPDSSTCTGTRRGWCSTCVTPPAAT